MAKKLTTRMALLAKDHTLFPYDIEWRHQPQQNFPLADKVAYFLGVASPVLPMWQVGTVIGALAGPRFPEWMALDFAVPITFLAVVAPMIRSWAHVAAAATSVVLALALYWVPYSAGLLIAGVVAMGVGAVVEIMVGRK